MGKEAAARLQKGRSWISGKALLETDALLFRGGKVRVSLARNDVKTARGEGHMLLVEHAGGTLTLELDTPAEKWAHDLLNPKSRTDKLGVKPGQRVCLLGVTGEALASELQARGADVSLRVRKDSDVIFLQIETPAGLSRIAKLIDSIVRDGCIWVVSPRGVTGLKDTEVMAAAKQVGLVDLKVVRFSDTHTANKFVIPVAER